MALVENRAVLLLAGVVNGLTFRARVVPPPDLKAYRSVMSICGLCLAVGASRWSAAPTRNGPAPTAEMTPTMPRMPTYAAILRGERMWVSRPPGESQSG